MNNDFKIYRDNIDAGVRGLHGQVSEISKGVDNSASTSALLAAAPGNAGVKPAISDFASRIGVVEEVLITQLPHGFGDPIKTPTPTKDQNTPTLKDISGKMDGIKPGLECDNGVFGRLKEMLFGNEKQKARERENEKSPSLGR